jgi:integrase
LKRWASRPLSGIRKADCQALHSRVGREHGRYAANRLLALLRAMFNKADGVGYEGPNPTAGIKKFPEEKRDRFLHGHELKAFFQSLADEPNATLRDYFAVALFTGGRKSNVLAMRWEDVDLAAGIWRIPETKSGIPVVVPLTAPVLAILQARQETTNGCPWVFPGRGKTGHLVEPKTAWKRIIERAGLEDVRPHDLRRSLGSWMAMTGAGLPLVGKMLGHTQAQTTQIYARLAVDPVRQAAEAATTAMLSAGGLLETPPEPDGGPSE